MPAPIVDVRSLTFRYGDGEPVFDGFDWQVTRGESWAIIGPSGCGKSTLLYLLAGLRQPSAGSVLVDGHPVPRPRASTGLILQNHGLLPWGTVWENAALGLRIGHFYRNKHTENDLPRPYPPALPLDQVGRWLERLDIAHLSSKYPTQISGGQQQRVAIARTLALQPNLLLMDEPFSSLDAITREELQDLTVELQREVDVTTVVVTHDVGEAACLGRKILVLTQPPNTQALIVDNPGAGEPGYRESQKYTAVTRSLRVRLGEREMPHRSVR